MLIRRRTRSLGRLAALLAAFGLLGIGPAHPSAHADVSGIESRVVVGNAEGTLHQEVLRGTGTAQSPSLPTQTGDREASIRASDKSESDAAIEADWSEALTKLATQYSAQFADSYLSAGLLDDGAAASFDAWMSFSEDPGSTVREALSALPFDTALRYGLPVSAPDLFRLQALTLAAINEALPAGSRAKSGIDDSTGSIEIAYATATRLPSEEITDAIVDALRTSGIDGADQVQVIVTYVDFVGEIVPEAYVQGGRGLYLTTTTPNQVYCTTGFSAKIHGGSSGVLTARHCDNTLVYRNEGGVIDWDRKAASYDQEFHRTLSANGHTTSATFKSGSPTLDIRDVHGTAASVANGNVCNYGYYSGYKCTQIDLINQCYSDAQGPMCGVVVVDDYVTQGGDSGGPWFLTFNAMGTHSGRVELSPGNYRSAYTNIAFVDPGMGVFVLTQ